MIRAAGWWGCQAIALQIHRVSLGVGDQPKASSTASKPGLYQHDFEESEKSECPLVPILICRVIPLVSSLITVSLNIPQAKVDEIMNSALRDRCMIELGTYSRVCA